MVEEIQRHRKNYQFMLSALRSEVNPGILLRAHSLIEAWRNLEERYNPTSITATQVLYKLFQRYSMKH